MDVDKVVRKLEPLMPAQVARWLRARDMADPDVRNMIEKEIIRTAYDRLGDFRKKPLLSLPPQTAGKGSIHLGTVIYETEKWPFAISQGELLRNMGIFGMSGSGKTNAAFHILRQLVKKRVPFLFWDWKRTARHLIPVLGGRVNIYTPGRDLSPLPFSPFIVPHGIEPRVYLNHVIDIMGDAYTLGDGSKRVLQKAIAACYDRGEMSPTVADILGEVEQMAAKDRVKGWKISALRALQSIEFSGLGVADATSQQALAERLTHENTVIELDALDQGSKKFLIPLMCLWLYHVQLTSPAREKLQLVIFIEEAHHVLYGNEQRAKETLLNMLLRQCREIGIGIIVIDQHPHLISTAALGNAFTTVCLNQRDPRDVSRAASLSLVDEYDKRYFSLLPVGRAIVKLQDRWRRPFLIKMPFVAVRKGSVTDDLLGRFLKGSLTMAGLRRAVARAFGSAPAELAHGTVLDQHALEFLEDVMQHQDDSVRMRYKRLGLSVDKGSKVKSLLVEEGFLEEQEIKVGRTYKVLLRVTRSAIAKLGLNKTTGRGSIAHEYWKRFYSESLRREGYQVEQEAARANGRVDVLARKGSECIAVEIETGNSDVVANVRNDLLSGFGKVLVVAPDERAFHRVEGALGKAGLLVKNRVHVVLREDVTRTTLPLAKLYDDQEVG